MHKEGGWKSMMAIVYAIICLFDFIIIPGWLGATRRELDTSIAEFTNLDVQVQLELIKSVWRQHEPLTLQGGGLFHLAFGALLTGSAVIGNKSQSTDA
jgi:hypothetical protein